MKRIRAFMSGLRLDAGKKEDRIILSVVNNLFSVSLVSLMTVLIGTILDSLVVSNFLSEKAFAAFGLAAPLANMVELTGSMIATGCAVVCGNLIGAGKAKEANKAFNACFTLCLMVGGTAGLLLLFLPQAVSFLISAENGREFMPLMLRYVRGMAPGIPAMILIALLNGIIQLDGGKKRVVAAACVICGVNLAGDLLVVLLTDWGLLGIGMTTALSYLSGTLVMLGHFRKNNTIFRPGISFSPLAEPLANGLPSVFNRSSTMLRNYFYNLFALQWGGAAGIVAWSTINSLIAFLSALPKAFGQTALLGSGVFYGEEDKDSLIRFMKYTVVLRTLVTGFVVIVVCAAAPTLIALFIPSTSDAFADAVSGLRWYALALLPYSLNIIMSNYLQSAKRKIASQAINLLDGFGMLVLWALLLLHIVGFRGLCMSFFLGKGTVTVLILVCLLAGRRRSRPVTERLLVLPEDFDVPEDAKFLATLTGREDAVNISDRIIAYCRGRGIDDRLGSHVGLALEEMSVIIIDHGFGDGKKHSIDIKVFEKNGQITLRMRDDCRAFTARQRIAIMDPEDPAANPGIRILQSVAKSVDHYSTLDMNYMIMHI